MGIRKRRCLVGTAGAAALLVAGAPAALATDGSALAPDASPGATSGALEPDAPPSAASATPPSRVAPTPPAAPRVRATVERSPVRTPAVVRVSTARQAPVTKVVPRAKSITPHGVPAPAKAAKPVKRDSAAVAKRPAHVPRDGRLVVAAGPAAATIGTPDGTAAMLLAALAFGTVVLASGSFLGLVWRLRAVAA